jgi:hypothetical protein
MQHGMGAAAGGGLYAGRPWRRRGQRSGQRRSRRLIGAVRSRQAPQQWHRRSSTHHTQCRGQQSRWLVWSRTGARCQRSTQLRFSRSGSGLRWKGCTVAAALRRCSAGRLWHPNMRRSIQRRRGVMRSVGWIASITQAAGVTLLATQVLIYKS